MEVFVLRKQLLRKCNQTFLGYLHSFVAYYRKCNSI